MKKPCEAELNTVQQPVDSVLTTVASQPSEQASVETDALAVPPQVTPKDKSSPDNLMRNEQVIVALAN